MSAGPAAFVLPQRLGRYEVISLLGRGAMGSVYKARDPALGREVAVKTLGGLLQEAPEQRDEYLERFQREGRAAAQLSHPNIVAVYDVGVDEGTGSPFIVMEYVPGVSLAALLRDQPELPVAQAMEIADQVAAALEEAHRHGIVHRDVKPGNVFVDPRGRVKVGDFGIARTADSELTQNGVSLGTPGYLAPEVVRGAPADARADVFALGALTYAVLAGRKPFPGVTPLALTAEVLERDPEPPHTVRPEVPLAASDAVLHALRKSPAERTPSVEAFRHELTSAIAPTLPGDVPTERVATLAPGLEPAPTMTVARPVPPRRRLSAALIAGAVLAVLAAALLVALRGRSGGGAGLHSTAAPAAVTAAPAPRPRAAEPAPRTPAPAEARRAPPAPPRIVVVAPPRDGREPHGGRADKPGRGHGRGRGKGKRKD